MEIILDSLKKAIDSLEAVLKRTNDIEYMKQFDDVTQYALRAGAIHNFEFTYELCWKYMKRWLSYNLGSVEVDGQSRRGLFRLAAEHFLIHDVAQWIHYHQARNLTTHTYNQDTADEVYEVVTVFLEDSKYLLKQLERFNED